MSPTSEPPPERVLAAFGMHDAEPELVAPDPVWRVGGVELHPAADAARASWVSQTMEALEVPGLRIAKPVRSTDGRWVIGGWRAMRSAPGLLEPRHDEVVSVAIRLHQVTAGFERPKFVSENSDVFAVADRAAWGEDEPELVPELGGRLFTILAGSRRETNSRPQLVHGDLFGTVRFAADAPPAVTDFVPYWRPAPWAAAVVVVDALAWGDADAEILRRWAHLPEWSAMLLRALLFRLAVHALHPASTPESLRGLEHAARLITGQ